MAASMQSLACAWGLTCPSSASEAISKGELARKGSTVCKSQFIGTSAGSSQRCGGCTSLQRKTWLHIERGSLDRRSALTNWQNGRAPCELVKRSAASSGGEVATAAAASTEEDLEEEKKKAEEYSTTMQQAMGDNALVYRHELGMNYAHVLPDLIVGSCLQKPADADRLKEEAAVGTVLCLQQDPDLAYFGLELPPIVERIKERGDMQHIRHEIRDFDPFSLRINLPQAVAKLHRAMRDGRGTAYVHCTAGLGRAPAVALAYMFWLKGFQLDEANAALQKVRRCSPKLQAIRAATCDILSGWASEPVEITWRHRGTAKVVEVAGLDVGWHNKLALEHRVQEGRWVVNRNLPIGTYYFKYIVDGHWTTSPDEQLTAPDNDGNVNNFIEVVGNSLNTPAWTMRKRLMEEDAPLTDEDRKILVEKLDALADGLE